jgi:hypothetical protein
MSLDSVFANPLTPDVYCACCRREKVKYAGTHVCEECLALNSRRYSGKDRFDNSRKAKYFSGKQSTLGISESTAERSWTRDYRRGA